MRELDTFTQKVRALEEQARTLKQIQYVGQDSILSYRTYSASTYDYSARIYEANPTKYIRLTLNHAVAKYGALLNLTAFYRADDPNVLADPIPYKTPTAPAIEVRWKQEVPFLGDKTSWIIRIFKGHFGVDHYDAYLKFFIEGTDTGSWTITEI